MPAMEVPTAKLSQLRRAMSVEPSAPVKMGTFIFTFFVGTVKEVWATGQWANLLTWKVFFSLGLFVFSLFIPKIINRLKFWQGIKTG